MLDKLKLNKFSSRYFLIKSLSILAALTLSSCSFNKPYKVNTEIICPNGKILLVKFINAKDLGEAIQVSYLNKKYLKTSENYTPIRLKDGRSFVLKNISPEVAASCILQESPIGQAEQDYIHHFIN